NRCQRPGLHRAQPQDRGGRNFLDRGERAHVLYAMIDRIVVQNRSAAHRRPREGKSMRTSLAGTLLSSLLIATALTPAGAADVTFERALNSDKEPQNWILHHGNYQGHRFSGL